MSTFPENIDELKQAFFGTEHQFIEVTRVISVDNDPDTFSPRLYNILGDACSQVENLLRILCEKLELSPDGRNFPSYFNKLNVNGILRKQRVDLLIGKNAYEPFVIQPDKETPSWWVAYNETKHNLPQGYKKGNLENTILALSGAYSLHCIAAYVRDYGVDILKSENWHILNGISLNTQSEFHEVGEKKMYSYIPKSKIFYCLSQFRDSLGAPVD